MKKLMFLKILNFGENLAMLHKVVSFILGTPPKSQKTVSPHQLSAYKKATRRRDLIRRESKIGATLFGRIPVGHNREFFCLDKHIWIWHEQWYDVTQKVSKDMQIRYEFQPRGVLKTVDGIAKGYVEGSELRNLLQAVQTYHDRIAVEVYGYATPQMA